ncbi:hypothetical protein [Chamaesiphon polymorphus]|uniref:Uncharacterized protein n=1 Tax=Chamaesiphon polymorphus CCALA 037 TaxID=2107692 RepID=A0A2T1GEZ3_9CYAN|nr:hypothetical protein [Chamaesiphon polymorphus]PSB56154.1 hypothetical protein C7B77_12810 [Chamaesiphon polymorphus CCALA 037]
MTIHFIGGENQAGKSWFVRALVEIIAVNSPRTIVADASIDKKIGTIYSPTFNRSYELQFSGDRPLAADPLLVYGNEWEIVVKIPAQARHYFLKWLHDISLEETDIDCRYWFVSRGKDDYPSEILEIFKERCFLVENQYYLANFQLFQQPEFDRNRTVKLPAFTRDPILIDRIERSGLPLSAFSERSQTIDRSRIFRFLQPLRESEIFNRKYC